jgi:hypothetical protein
MKKVILVLIGLCIFTGFFATYSDAQTRTVRRYGQFWTISPMGGFMLPLGTFADNYKASGRVGLDIAYTVNKETAIYANFGYNFLSNKDPNGPSSSYISYTVGPRYHFRNPKLSSSFFLEAGVGGYTFNSDAYTITDPSGAPPSQIAASSDTKLGVNAGLGADVNLGKSIDLLVKGKYHTIFREGGTSSFMSVDAGLAFKVFGN